jgi:hypothetical protein
MAQAKRVHSTPRKTAPKIKVDKPEESHSAAFCDLESPVRELFCMAEITREVACRISRGPENEIAVFAICRLCDMVVDLHANYRTDLHTGKAVS